MSRSVTTTEQPAEPAVEEEWLLEAGRRDRTRTVLVGLLAAALLVLAGVQLQRHLGTTAAAAAAGPTAGAMPAGMPAMEGFPGAMGAAAPTGAATGTDSGTGTAGSGVSATQAVAAPAVIGTVRRIRAGVWTVVDLGGTAHRVEVDDATTLTRPLSDADTPLGPLATVSVVGTTSADGTVTATSITLR